MKGFGNREKGEMGTDEREAARKTELPPVDFTKDVDLTDVYGARLGALAYPALVSYLFVLARNMGPKAEPHDDFITWVDLDWKDYAGDLKIELSHTLTKDGEITMKMRLKRFFIGGGGEPEVIFEANLKDVAVGIDLSLQMTADDRVRVNVRAPKEIHDATFRAYIPSDL